MTNLPFGVWVCEKLGCCSSYNTARRNISFRWLVFVLTFITYTAYHASRKPISVVKNVLNQDCRNKTPPVGVNATADPHWCDWRPFVGEDSNTLLGFLDSSYLFSYAVAMFFSGMVADRINLRYFLTGGMLFSALFTAAFGVAFYLNIHSLAFFICVQVACGVFQASGWPGVVTVMGNWNGKSNRGLIFGIWNSHTSVGNIVGSLMASVFVTQQWGLSFIVPGAFLALVGVVNFLLLPPHPSEVGCDPPLQSDGVLLIRENVDYDEYSGGSGAETDTTAGETKALASPAATSMMLYTVPRSFHPDPASPRPELIQLSPFHRAAFAVTYGSLAAGRAEASTDELAGLINGSGSEASDSGPEGSPDPPQRNKPSTSVNAIPGLGGPETAINFIDAIRIPGVLPFSVCLFFAKLVSYTFLYWLPRYLHSAAKYGPSESANLSTLFDLGGILGGILAGVANDWTGAPGVVCVILLIVAIPTMFVYQAVATVNHVLNMLLLVLVGVLVNGPYALITTAVSADLGTSLRGNARSLATVTAIIDGTGSVGAALGPLLAGAVSSGNNWTGVFVILMFSDAIAVASLALVLRSEIRRLCTRRQHRRSIDGADGAA